MITSHNTNVEQRYPLCSSRGISATFTSLGLPPASFTSQPISRNCSSENIEVVAPFAVILATSAVGRAEHSVTPSR
jgi:hypothetical protein